MMFKWQKKYLVLVLSLLLLSLLPGCAPRHAAVHRPEIAADWQMRAPLKNHRVIPSQAPLVVIDAGHGGKDFGTHSAKHPKYEEKSLALSTAFLVNHYLTSMGYRTVMTRTDDVFIPLPRRAEIANSLGAALFVSVHYNSAPNAKAEGVEVYYYKSDKQKKRSDASKILASGVLDQVIEKTYAKSRGVKHGNFAVVRETKMPAILVEAGFLTNKSERERIYQRSYLKRIASGIAFGIDRHLKKN